MIDPYAMALGKLDRGFPTDLADIVFLVRRDLVNLTELENSCKPPFAAHRNLT